MLKLSNVSSVVRETGRGSKGDVGEPGPKGELGDQGAPGPAIFVDSGEEVVTVKGQKVNDICAVTFDWPTEDRKVPKPFPSSKLHSSYICSVCSRVLSFE